MVGDTQSTIAGLNAQDCPGDRTTTVANCLANGNCGCIYGDAVLHLRRILSIEATEPPKP